MQTTTNMGLTAWDQLSDPFNHTQLFNNWAAVDVHDHSPTKGVLIPTAGLANSAISTAKLQNGAVTSAILAANSVTTSAIVNGAVTAAKLATGAGALAFQTVTTSIAAQVGFCYAVTAGTPTLTLPTPIAGAQILVVVGSGITATLNAAPNTIAGPGLVTAVASLTLSTGGAYLSLVGDGSAWRIVGGQIDSGWVNFSSFGTNVSAGTIAPAARQIASTVYLRGDFNANALLTAPATLGTIPVAIPNPPLNSVFFNTGQYNSSNIGTANVKIGIGGNVIAQSANITNGNTVSLNNVYYQVN